MKTKIIYILTIILIFSIFYPISKNLIFNNYVINATKEYVQNNMDKMPGINTNDFKAEIPIIILKKENYIKYLIKSPNKNIDVNSYYIEVENNNGNLKYDLKIKKEG